MRIPSLGPEDPLEEGMATHSCMLAWRIHGQRSLVGYSPWDLNESDMTEAAEHARTRGCQGSACVLAVCAEKDGKADTRTPMC